MSYLYKKNGKIYWQWKYAAMKALMDIAHLRDLTTRFHYDTDCLYCSDKDYVNTLRDAIKRYNLFLAERDNPIEYGGRE